MDQRSLAILALIAAAYLVAIWILLRGERRGRLATGQQVLLVCGTAFVPVLLAVPLYHPGFSRFAVLTSPFLALALLWFAFCIHRWDRVRLTAVAVLALIAIGLHVSLATRLLTRPKPQPSVSDFQLGTSLYELNVVSFSHWIARHDAHQGGIAKFNDRYLLATGEGDLYLFRRSEDAQKLELQHLQAARAAEHPGVHGGHGRRANSPELVPCSGCGNAGHCAGCTRLRLSSLLEA